MSSRPGAKPSPKPPARPAARTPSKTAAQPEADRAPAEPATDVRVTAEPEPGTERQPLPETSDDRTPLIRLRGVTKHFPITRGIVFQKKVGAVHAVDGIDLDIYPGETVGLVGETGCGKSTTARLIMRLYNLTGGTIEFEGQDISGLKGKALREVRRNMQMIFQDPYASLNPRKPVGAIIGEPMRIHKTVAKDKVKGEVEQLMELVGLNPEHYNRYPHEFSGGQRQRIGVARSLALRPRLIVCDEPVSALDVSIQAQILNLLEDLQEEFNLTYLFIAHDLSVVKHVSDRVAVMYLGRIVEIADGETLYVNPKHPYTGALLSAVPIADPDLAAQKKRIILEGDVPSAHRPAQRLPVPPSVPASAVPEVQGGRPGAHPAPRGTARGMPLSARGPGDHRSERLIFCRPHARRRGAHRAHHRQPLPDRCSCCCTRGRAAGSRTCSGARATSRGARPSSATWTGSPSSRRSCSG